VKSTLLRALQTERYNVEENMPSSLQQNNSAVEQVESRDLIIDELNDRVAVLQKMVVLGNPSQLQEMNDEAPRTQKLVDDGQCTKEVERIASKRSLIGTPRRNWISSERNLDKVVNEPAEGI
jgi:hypothetical protein